MPDRSNRPLKVLLVEDNQSTQFLTAEYLGTLNCVVDVASSGQQALDILKGDDCKPDVMLVDLFMPVMGGWDFLKAVGFDQELRDVPVILTTGVMVPYKAEEVYSNVYAVLSKPYAPEYLASKMEEIRARKT